MIRRNHRPDWRPIKALRSYTIDEAASALRVHRNVVRYWTKKYAFSVFTEQRPHLIQGQRSRGVSQGSARVQSMEVRAGAIRTVFREHKHCRTESNTRRVAVVAPCSGSLMTLANSEPR